MFSLPSGGLEELSGSAFKACLSRLVTVPGARGRTFMTYTAQLTNSNELEPVTVNQTAEPQIRNLKLKNCSLESTYSRAVEMTSVRLVTVYT